MERHFLIADIHGCYEEYITLIEKMGLSDDDLVYVLGDSMDRGKEPIKVLKDIMNRPNFIYILGNHDLMMITAMRPLMEEITEKSIDTIEVNDDIYMTFGDWMSNGGGVTLNQFITLDKYEQEDILCYLEEAAVYETIEYDDKLFILIHAGLDNFSVDKELDEYLVEELVWDRLDYSRQYFPGDKIFLVTGHTPVQIIREDGKPIIYKENNNIAIDCGCVFGGRLAAYCIETGEEFYVNSLSE